MALVMKSQHILKLGIQMLVERIKIILLVPKNKYQRHTSNQFLPSGMRLKEHINSDEKQNTSIEVFTRCIHNSMKLVKDSSAFK